MSEHKLIMEGWRDFFRRPAKMFNEEHDEFYYKKSLWTYRSSGPQYSEPELVSADELIKIITDPQTNEHIVVRPSSSSKSGDFYDWRKFKFVNSKVEQIMKEREEAKRKEQQAKTARIDKQLNSASSDLELALASIELNSVNNLVLYHTKILERDGLPMVIGMIAVDDMHGPCIPNTLQVKFSAVSRKFQRQGFGSILYRLAAAHAKVSRNGGISSDHTGGTSVDATRRWAAIDKDTEFYKRSTKSGSDTFDYGGYMTPNDPEDDCEDFTSNGSVTNHSYGVSDKTVGVYNTLIDADKNGAGYGQKNSTELNDKATKVFASSYSHRTRR